MRTGGVQLVPSNSWHGARNSHPGVEAYVCQPCTRAACTWLLQESDFQQTLHWRNYIDDKFTYKNVFTTVLSAWKFRWDVLCDYFDEALMRLRSAFDDLCVSDPEKASIAQSDAVTNEYFQDEHFTTCVVANQSLPDMLHSANPTCIRDSNRVPLSATKKSKSVQFDDNILIHIGLDDEITMGRTYLEHDVLHRWNDKPWTGRRIKPVKNGSTRQHNWQHEPNECRTTDAFYNVPSRWIENQIEHNDQDFEDPEDVNHFLHEAPDSLQNLFDALLARGVVEGPRIHDSIST